MKRVLLEQQFATEADLELINDKVKTIVDDAVDFAEKSPYPTVDEVYKDIYSDDTYPYILD